MIRTAAPKGAWVGRTRTFSLWLLIVLVAASIGVLLLAARDAYAAPATFTVNTTADTSAANDGACQQPISIVDTKDCTLREAINAANSDSNPADTDLIRFSIQGNGPHTISVGEGTPSLGDLPTITQPVSINGYSEPGSSVNTATTGTNAVLKIVLDGSNAGSTASGLVVTAPNTTVKGLVINSFNFSGVIFDEVTPSDAGRTLEGCFIGTDASGSTEKGNAHEGVFIDNGEGNVIGGTTLAARNLISGNHTNGIFLGANHFSGARAPATGNRVEGNLIGTKRDGTTALGNNSSGVNIAGGSDNTIGGARAARNTIAFNGSDGVQVTTIETSGQGGRGNSILSNRIFGNFTSEALGSSGLGIDLVGGTENDYRVTANDGDNPATLQPDPDSDTGANRLQNFPVITSATILLNNTTTISGKLSSRPSTTFTIQFFSNPAAEVNRSGFGEGKTFLRQIQVTTNRNGNTGNFSITTNQGAVKEGEFITATATRNATGDTSEFSRAKRVEPAAIEG